MWWSPSSFGGISLGVGSPKAIAQAKTKHHHPKNNGFFGAIVPLHWKKKYQHKVNLD